MTGYHADSMPRWPHRARKKWDGYPRAAASVVSDPRMVAASNSGAVLGMLVVVLVMYTLFIFPEFKGLYAGFGDRLPRLTGLVFVRGAALSALLVLLAVLARCGRRVRVILTIFIYFLVATFVSAMYLPIFSLGSAI